MLNIEILLKIENISQNKGFSILKHIMLQKKLVDLNFLDKTIYNLRFKTFYAAF